MVPVGCVQVTHSPGSFYEAFEPEEARRLTECLEIHYTPKHGSWLNIAECEFSVLQRQCLNRRIDSAEFLGHEVNAWQASRNAIDSQINWQFTTGDARVKFSVKSWQNRGNSNARLWAAVGCQTWLNTEGPNERHGSKFQPKLDEIP